MTILTALILLLLLAAVGLSIFGLFNQKPSIFIAIAGLLSLAVGALGGWHAWLETGDIPWTVAYGALALTGFGAVVRQLVGKLTPTHS